MILVALTTVWASWLYLCVYIWLLYKFFSGKLFFPKCFLPLTFSEGKKSEQTQRLITIPSAGQQSWTDKLRPSRSLYTHSWRTWSIPANCVFPSKMPPCTPDTCHIKLLYWPQWRPLTLTELSWLEVAKMCSLSGCQSRPWILERWAARYSTAVLGFCNTMTSCLLSLKELYRMSTAERWALRGR